MCNHTYFIWISTPEDLEVYQKMIEFEAKCDYAFKGEFPLHPPLKYGAIVNPQKPQVHHQYFLKFFKGNQPELEKMQPEVTEYENTKTFPIWTKFGIVVFQKSELFSDHLGYHNPLGELIF